MASVTGQRLLAVKADSAEGQRLLRDIRSTYLDTQYRTGLNFEQLFLVKNDTLARKFQDKKRDLYAVGGNAFIQEMHVFACFKRQESVLNIISDGAMVKPSVYNFLGRSDLGVNLCRHADVQLKSAESGTSRVKRCWLVVFKVLPGRTLNIPADESVKFPTQGYDSHMSSTRALVNDSLHVQAINSQIYLYEFTNSQQLAIYPTNVLPYAVLTFSKSESMGQPQSRATDGVSHQPAVQQPSQHQLPMQQMVAAHNSGSNLMTQQRTISHGNIQQGPPPLTPITSQGQPQQPHVNYSASRQVNQRLPMTDPRLRTPYQEQMSSYTYQQPSSSAVMPNVGATGSEMRYPPNRTATATQLPFHAADTSDSAALSNYQQLLQQELLLRQMQEKQAQQKQLQQQQQQQQQHSTGYGGLTGLSNMQQNISTSGTATVNYRPPVSSTVVPQQAPPRPRSAGLGMRLPTVVSSSVGQSGRYSADNNTVNSISARRPSVPTPASSYHVQTTVAGTSQPASLVTAPGASHPPTSFPSVITIQPEGTAPHEDPTLLGVWPWVKTEPQISGYGDNIGENPYHYTKHLDNKRAGTEAMPIIIEPIDSPPPPPPAALVHNADQPQHATSSSSLFDPYPPSVHFSSNLTVALDLSSVSISDSSASEQHVTSSVVTGTVSSQPTTSSREVVDPVSSWVQKNISGTQRSEPLSDRDEFQRLYGSDPYRTDLQGPCSTSSTTPATSASPLKSKPTFPTLTEHGTSKPRPSIVSVSSTWDVPLMTTGGRVAPRILRTSSTASSRHSRSSSLESSSQHNVPNTHTVVPGDSSSTVDESNPNLTALLSSGMVPSSDRTTTASLGTNSTTVTTPKPRNAFNPFSTLLELSTSTSVSTTSTVTMAVTTGVTSTVASSSVLVASTSSLKIGNGEHSTKMVCSDPVQTSTQTIGERSKLSQHESDVPSSLLPLNVPVVSSGSSMQSSNGHNTIKPNINAGISDTTNSETLDSVHKVDLNLLSNEQISTSKADEIGILSNFKTDKSAAQKNTEKTANYLSKMLPSETTDSGNINVEPMELDFMLSETNQSSIRDTAKEDKPEKVEPLILSISGKKSVLSNASSRSTTSAITNEQDIIVGLNTSKGQQSGKDKSQSFIISSQTVAKSKDAVSDPAVSSNLMRTGDGSSLTVEKPVKKKKKRLQKSQYTSLSSLKKLIERQKVVVAEDGTIQLVNETVYKTASKETSGLSAAQIAPPISVFKAGDKENKKSKKENKKRKKEKKHKLQKTGIISSSSKVIKPDTPKVLIASPQTKQKVPVSKKSGSPRSHLYPVGKTGLKYKLKANKKSFAVKSSSLSSATFVKPKPFITPFDRFGQGNKAQASDDSLDEGKIPHQAHLSFGILNSNMGIGNLSPAIAKSVPSVVIERAGTPSEINVSEALNSKEYQPVVRIECDIQKHLHKYKIYEPSDMSVLSLQPKIIPLVPQDQQLLDEEPCELILKISEVTSLEETAFSSNKEPVGKDNLSSSDEGLAAETSMSDTDIPSTRRVTLKGSTEKVQITIKPVMSIPTGETDTDINVVSIGSKKNKKRKKKTKKKSKERVPPLIVQTKKGRAILNSEVSEDDNKVSPKKDRKLKHSKSQSKGSGKVLKDVQQSESDSDVVRKKKKRKPKVLSKQFVEDSDESDSQTLQSKPISPLKLIIQSSNDDKDFRVLTKSNKKQPLVDTDAVVGSVKGDEKETDQISEKELERIVKTENKELTKITDNPIEDNVQSSEPAMTEPLNSNNEITQDGERGLQITERRYDGRAALPDVVMSSKEVCEKSPDKWSDAKDEVIENLKNENQIYSFIKSCRIESDKAKYKPVSGSDRERERIYRRRTRSRSYSRSPERRRRRRTRSSSRSRSRSPYQRSKHSRKYSRSPSPWRNSRSPRSRRRYSRSPSPYRSRKSRRSRSPRRRSPRRRRSRSPSSWKRYSRSPSPRRRSSRSPSSRYKRSRSRSSSLRRNRSRSRSPSLRHKRSRSPAKRGRSPSPVSHKVIGPSAAAGSRPYSPSSPTESPTKELSPAGKKLSEKRKTAVDELFAIAYGKTPVASKASSGTSTVATALTTTTATTAVSTVTSSSVPCTLSIEDSKAISKKLSFSQYKKRHGKGSTGSMDSSIETDKSQPNESKKESGEKDQSHEAKTDTADVDDADIALIQEQYSNLKATIDTMPADEDKLEFMIEYKRVGDQLKQLKAQQSGETGNALEPLKVNFSSMNQPWPNTSSPVSPRPKQQNRGSGLASGLWRSSSCSSAVSEKPDWDISTFEPESEKRGEMFNAYSGPPKEASPQVNKEINIKALLETIKDIPKTLGLPPTTSSTTVNNDAVQNILNMAKAQGNIGLPSSSSASSVPSLMSGIKPLMADLKTPSAGYIRSISMPAVESNEQPTFYTGIHSGSSMKKNTPVFSRQVSPYASTSVRDPRLNRRDSSDTSQTTGLSPRDSAGISPRGGTSPRVDVALQGMASPPHASPRYNPYPQSSTQQQNQGQDQQLSVYNPPPLNRRHPQQQSHPPMPGYPPPPEGHFLPPLPPTDPPIPDPPLKLIPIDVPEINYEGMKGSLDDPRFMPRDAEVWNPFPTKGPPRHIPLDVAKIYENDDMEISDTEDTSEIIGESSDSSFTLMEQATTKIIKSPNVAIAARDPRLSITARKNKTENTVETQIQKPKEIQDNSSTTSTDAQVINPQSKKRPVVAAAQWANLSKNWETSGTDQRPYVSHKIGKSNKQVLTLINHVESLSSNELDTFAVEMNRQLDITMSNVMKESLFCDPTDGITAEKRLELIEDNSVNPAVLGELKLEHHLFQLDKVINTLKETLANLGEQMQQPSCPQNIVAEYDQNEERLHAVELAREHEHKRLEKDLRRYQKSDCVELIPEEFLLAGEIDGYITEEGCLLFLLERLSLSDCRNLYCYKIEIERCTGNLEKLSGMDIAEVRKCRKMIGYWHSQRRLLLISICCASIKKKQELTERFIDKLAWYRTVQTEIEKQEGNTNTQEVMLAFAAERIERLETYLNILRHVQLSKNAWEPIEPVEEIPHAEKQSPQSKAPTSASISTSASIKPAFNTTSAILPLSSSHPTQHENIKSPPTVAPVSVKSNVSFTLREKLKNAESQKQEAKGNETGEVSGKKTTKEKVLDSSLGNVKRKSLDSQVEVKKTLTQSKTERRKSVDDSGVQSEAKATVKPLQSETAPSRNNNNADDSHNKDKTKTIEKKISSKEKDNDLNLNNAEKLSVKCSEKQTTKSSKVERDKEHVEKAHKPLDKQSSKEGKSHKISDHTDKLSKQSSKPRKSSESEQISKEKNIKPRKSSESEQISKEKLIKPCKSSEGESEQKSNEKHSKPHKSSDTEQKANEKHHKPKKSSETEQKSNEKHNKPHKSSETEQKSKEKHNKPNKSSETELKSKEKHSSAESKSNKHGKSSKSDSVKEPLEQKAEESKSNKHGKSSKIDSVNEPLEQKAEISVQKTQKVTKDSKSVKSKPVQPSEKTKLKHDVASNKTDEHEKHKMHKKHSKDEKHKASGSAPSQFSSSKVKSGKESVQQFSSKTFTSKPTVETNTDEKSKGLANKSSDKIFKSSAEEKSIRRSNCKESHLSSKHLGVVSNNPGATAKVSDSISKDKKSNEKHSGDKEFSSAARESSKESNTTKESKSSTLKEYKSGSLHGVATTSRRAPRKSIKIVVPVPLHETLQRCVSPGICDSLGFKETSMEPDSLPNIVTPSLSSDDKVKPSSSKSTPVSCNIKSVNISDKKLSDITSKVSVSFPRLILKRSDENVTSAKIIKKPGKGGKFKGIKLAKSTASTTLEGKGAEVKINVDKTNYSESVTSQTIVTTTVTGSIATTSSASSVTSSLGTKVIFSSSSSSMPDGQIKLTTKPKLEKVPSGLESALASTLESGKSVTSDAEKMLTITSREQTNSDKSNSKKSVNEARVDAVKCIKASRVTAAKSTEVKKDIERSDQSIDAKIGSIVDKVISGKLHTEGKSAAEKSKSDHGVFDGIKTSSVKEIMENPETKIKAGQSIKDKNEITNEPNNQSAKSKETNKAKTETKDNIAQSSSKISKAKAIFATISEKTVDVGPSKKGSSKADNTKSMTGQIELEIEKELSASKGVKTIKASVVKPTSCDSITLPMNKKKALPMDTKSILKSTQSMDDTDVKITDSKEGDDINKARTSKNSGPKTNIQVTQKDKSIKTLGVVSKSVPTAIKKGVITVRRLSSDVQTNTGASKPIIPTVLKPVPTQTKVKPGANIPVIPLETITSPPKTCVIEKNVHEDDKEKETTKMSQIKAKLVPSTSEDSDIPQIPLECKASPEANSKGQKESKLSGEVPKIGQKRARSPELSMAEETNKKQKISTVKQDTSVTKNMSEYEMKEKPKIRAIRTLSNNSEPRSGYKRTRSRSPGPSRRSRSPESKRHRSRARSGSPAIPWRMKVRSGEFSPRRRGSRDWSPHQNVNKAESPGQSPSHQSSSGRGRSPRHRARSPGKRSPNRRSGSMDRSYPKRSRSPSRRGSPSVRKWTAPPRGRSPNERSWPPQARSPHQSESSGWKNWSSHDAPARRSPGRRNPSPERWSSPGRYQNETDWTPETHQRKQSPYYGSADEGRHSPFEDYGARSDDRSRERPLHTRRSPRNAPQRAMSPPNRGRWSPIPDKFEEGISVEIYNDSSETRTVAARGRGRGRGSPRGRPRGRGRGRGGSSSRGRGRGRGTKTPDNRYVGGEDFPHDQDERMRNPNTSWSSRTEVGCSSRGSPRGRGRTLRSSAESSFQNVVDATADIINSTVLEKFGSFGDEDLTTFCGNNRPLDNRYWERPTRFRRGRDQNSSNETQRY